MKRYLPHALVATAFVIVLPAVLVWTIAPPGGAMVSILTVLVATALSVAAASAASALWMRHPGSRDVVFADLMLWGWLRRLRAERRLAEAREVIGLGASGQDPTPASVPQRVAALKRLGALLEARDAETHGHTRRVTRHAERIAKAMHRPPAEVAKVRTAAALHDVGKLRTPPEILHKPGRLTEQEFDVIKRHPLDGAEMLAGIGDAEVTAMVRHHHERLDGAGYPDGLAGEQIPLGARIIAVADTFDAMTSGRAYHGASNHKRALDVLTAEAGKQLDAAAVTAFLGYYSGRTSVAWSAVVTAAPQRLLGWLGSASERLGTGVASIAQVLPAAGAAVLLAGPMPGEGATARAGSPEARQHDAAGQTGRVRLATTAPSRSEALARVPKRRVRSVPGDRPSRRAPNSSDRRPSPTGAPLAPVRALSEPTAPGGTVAPAPPSRAPSPGPDAKVPPRPALPGSPGAELVPVELPAVERPAVELPSVQTPTIELSRVDLPRVVVPDVALPDLATPLP